MDNSAIKNRGPLPGLIASSLLLATTASFKVNAEPIAIKAPQGIQLAHGGGGWPGGGGGWHGGGGGWHGGGGGWHGGGGDGSVGGDFGPYWGWGWADFYGSPHPYYPSPYDYGYYSYDPYPAYVPSAPLTYEERAPEPSSN